MALQQMTVTLASETHVDMHFVDVTDTSGVASFTGICYGDDALITVFGGGFDSKVDKNKCFISISVILSLFRIATNNKKKLSLAPLPRLQCLWLVWALPLNRDCQAWMTIYSAAKRYI